MNSKRLTLILIALSSLTAQAVMPPYKKACLDALRTGIGAEDGMVSIEGTFDYIKSSMRFQGRRLTEAEADRIASRATPFYIGGPTVANLGRLRDEFAAIQQIFQPDSVDENIDLLQRIQLFSHQTSRKAALISDLGDISKTLDPRVHRPMTAIQKMTLYSVILQNAEFSGTNHHAVVAMLNSLLPGRGPQSYDDIVAELSMPIYLARMDAVLENENVVVMTSAEERRQLYRAILLAAANSGGLNEVLLKLGELRDRQSQPIPARLLIEFYSTSHSSGRQ